MQNESTSSPMSSSSLQGNGDPLEHVPKCPPICGMALNDPPWGHGAQFTLWPSEPSSLRGLTNNIIPFAARHCWASGDHHEHLLMCPLDRGMALNDPLGVAAHCLHAISRCWCSSLRRERKKRPVAPRHKIRRLPSNRKQEEPDRGPQGILHECATRTQRRSLRT